MRVEDRRAFGRSLQSVEILYMRVVGRILGCGEKGLCSVGLRLIEITERGSGIAGQPKRLEERVILAKAPTGFLGRNERGSFLANPPFDDDGPRISLFHSSHDNAIGQPIP